MTKGRGDFENTIRKSFEGFEADVRPELWNGIQSQLGNGIAAGIATTATKSILGVKGIVAVVSAGIITGMVIYNIFKENQEGEVVSETTPSTSVVVNDHELVPNKLKSIPDQQKTLTGITSEEEEISKLSPNEMILVEDATEQIVETDNPQVKKELVKDDEMIESNNSFMPLPAKRVSRGFLGSEPNHVSESRQKAYAEQRKRALELEKKNSQTLLSINASELKGEAPFEVYFSTSSNTERVQWNFGDNTEEITDLSTNHTFQKAGKYIVIAVLEDKFGQVKENRLTIVAEKGSILGNIPNVITPNGDGKNDVFKLKTEKIQSISVVISNRSGKKIYHWESLDGEWDGRDYSGVNVPEGIYFYTIIAKGLDGELYQENKSLTLQR